MYPIGAVTIPPELWLFVLLAVLFLFALARVLTRRSRELRRLQDALPRLPELPADPPAAPNQPRGFPVLPAARAGARGGGEDGSTLFVVSGVSRVTGELIELRLPAANVAIAAALAEAHAVTPTDVRPA